MSDWTWVYKASEDPLLGNAQPSLLGQATAVSSGNPFSWPSFGVMPPLLPNNFGNNLFLSDPSFQQQQNFVSFGQENEVEDEEESEDYDEGEIVEDDDEEEESAPAQVQQGLPVKNVANNVGYHAKATPSQPKPQPSSGLLSQLGTHGQSDSKPPPADKATTQKMLDDLRAKLKAQKGSGTPAKTSSSNGPFPPRSATQASNGTSAAPASMSPISQQLGNQMDGSMAMDLDELLEQGKAAAAASDKKGASKVPLPTGSQAAVNDQKIAETKPSTTEMEMAQHKQIQEILAKLPIQQVQPPEQLSKGPSRTGPQPQQGTVPADSRSKIPLKLEAQSPRPKVSLPERVSNLVVDQDSQRISHVARPVAVPTPTPQPSVQELRSIVPSAPAVAESHTVEAPSFSTSSDAADHYEDVEEWLELTGYHDLTYRQGFLSRQRKMKRLRAELEDLEMEDALDRRTTRGQSSMPTDVATGRRSVSVMPPPPLPNKYVNGNVTSSNSTPLDTPPATATSTRFDHNKRPRSPQMVSVGPAEKAPRTAYNADRRSGRSPSPRAGPAERRRSAANDSYHPEYEQTQYYDEERRDYQASGGYKTDAGYGDRRRRDDSHQTRGGNRGRGNYRGGAVRANPTWQAPKHPRT